MASKCVKPATHDNAFVVASCRPQKRQEAGRSAFMVEWTAAYAPVPKDSVMYTCKGYYLALADTMWSPDAPQGENDWKKFSWADVIAAGDLAKCGCGFIFPQAEPAAPATSCNSSVTRLWAKGQVVCHDSKLYVAKNGDIPFRLNDKTNWCGGYTADQVIGKILCMLETNDGELG